MIQLQLTASKKATRKPYLARITMVGERLERQFAKRQRFTNTQYVYCLDVEPGDIVDGRGSIWVGDDYAGEYFCALVSERGVVSISRQLAQQLLAMRPARAIGHWSVEDGQMAYDCETRKKLGPTPRPGEGDCAGVIMRDEAGNRTLWPYPVDYEQCSSVAYVGDRDAEQAGRRYEVFDLTPRIPGLRCLSASRM